MDVNYTYEKKYKRTQYEDIGLQFKTLQRVNAKYIRSFDPSDNGNRLIEALPPVRSERECIRDFVRTPYWTAECREKNERERMSLCSHLSEFRIPRDFTMNVDFEIYSMLVRCYRTRIPNESPGFGGPGFYKTTGEAVPGGLLIGNSGAGKTTAILHSLQYYPQLIIHEMEDSRMLQVPYINVLCPPDASVKGFYDLCLDEIERITGQPIFERNKRNTADAKGQIFRRQALRYNIGLVVVDEVQNIMNVQKKTLMQHFLNLSNELCVPFLFVGTERAREFFENEEFYIKRRTGVLIEAGLFEKNEVWENFLQKLWNFQWTREVIPYSQEFSETFFKESAGNIDRVKELFLVAQKEAIQTGFDTVKDFTPQFIENVSHKYFKISYKELNRKAANPQVITTDLFGKKTFHEKEELNNLIMHGAYKQEKKELLKYKIVENIGSISNGKFSLQDIENAFKRVSDEIDILNVEEFDVSMRVLQILSKPKEEKTLGVAKKHTTTVEELVKELPMFEGFGA